MQATYKRKVITSLPGGFAVDGVVYDTLEAATDWINSLGDAGDMGM